MTYPAVRNHYKKFDMKQYYDKNGKPVFVSKNRVMTNDGKIELNVAGLKPEKLAEKCGLYEYQHPQVKITGKKLGKLLFDDKTGTCTRELVELTLEELAEQQEAEARLQFEAEQDAEQAATKEQKFLEWKAKKGKQKANKLN